VDRTRRLLISRGLFAGVIAGLIAFSFFAGIRDSDNDPSCLFYDLFLLMRREFRLEPYADPFLVLIENTTPFMSEDEAPATWAYIADLAAKAGAQGAFLGSVVRSESMELDNLAKKLSNLPTAVTGGICVDSDNWGAAPLWHIGGVAPKEIPEAGGYIRSLGAFASLGTGFLNVRPDRDSAVRRIPLVYRRGESFIPGAALAAATAALGVHEGDLSWKDGRFLRLGDKALIPVDSHGAMILDFPLSWDSSFFRYEAADLTRIPPSSSDIARLRQELRGTFLFYVDSGTAQIYGPSHKRYPAAGVYPVAVNQILLGRFIAAPPDGYRAGVYIAFAALTGFLMALATVRLRRLWLIPAFAGLIFFSGSAIAFIVCGMYVDPVPAIATAVVLLCAGILWYAFAAHREKRHEDIIRDQERIFTELGKKSAGITHGIRGQAAFAINMTDLLQSELLSAQGKKELDFVRRSLAEISESLEGLMALVRGERDSPELIDLRAIAKGFALVYADQKAGIRTRLVVPEEPALILAKRNDIVRILEVLYSNALDSYDGLAREDPATDSQPCVFIEVETDGISAGISVEDGGCGIPDCAGCETRACMSCPSIRLGKTGKTKGSGYGLFWTRSIIADYGADLAIRSSGAGTRVTVRWRMAFGEARA
jgi:signal transduction histidine kinase